MSQCQDFGRAARGAGFTCHRHPNPDSSAAVLKPGCRDRLWQHKCRSSCFCQELFAARMLTSKRVSACEASSVPTRRDRSAAAAAHALQAEADEQRWQRRCARILGMSAAHSSACCLPSVVNLTIKLLVSEDPARQCAVGTILQQMLGCQESQGLAILCKVPDMCDMLHAEVAVSSLSCAALHKAPPSSPQRLHSSVVRHRWRLQH